MAHAIALPAAGDPCLGCRRPLLQGGPNGSPDGSAWDLLDGRCGTCRLLYSIQSRVPLLLVRGTEVEATLRSQLQRVDRWLADCQRPEPVPRPRGPGVLPLSEEQIMRRQRSRSPRRDGG